MGRSKQTVTKAQRTKEVAKREQSKNRVPPLEPEDVTAAPGMSLEVPKELLSKHQEDLSEFRKQVFALAQKIPAGKTTSYGAMAEVLGSSPRAVGGALKNNPFAPIVPCHRIVASTGAMGGFQGDTKGDSIEKKINLLKSEGVKLDFASGGARVQPESILSKEELQNIAGSSSPTKKSPSKRG